jgi:hypothetical protein
MEIARKLSKVFGEYAESIWRGPSITKSRADFFTQIRPIYLGDLGTSRKKFILFMIGADILHFVVLENADYMLKIM